MSDFGIAMCFVGYFVTGLLVLFVWAALFGSPTSKEGERMCVISLWPLIFIVAACVFLFMWIPLQVEKAGDFIFENWW
jgi:hypothetical protein